MISDCRALDNLLQQTPHNYRSSIAAIAIAGTTTTSLLVDRCTGNVLADPILYNQPQNESIVAAAQVCTSLPSCSQYPDICRALPLNSNACAFDRLSQITCSATQAIVPDGHSAGASVSSLCKLLFWQQQGSWQKVSAIAACFVHTTQPLPVSSAQKQTKLNDWHAPLFILC